VYHLQLVSSITSASSAGMQRHFPHSSQQTQATRSLGADFAETDKEGADIGCAFTCKGFSNAAAVSVGMCNGLGEGGIGCMCIGRCCWGSAGTVTGCPEMDSVLEGAGPD
jgi:hypothetical protein